MQQVSHETAAEDDAKASDLLAGTIAALEKEVQDAPNRRRRPRPTCNSGCCTWRRAGGTMPCGPCPASRAANKILGRRSFRPGHVPRQRSTSDAGRRATEATLHLNKAASRLAELGSLTVRNLAFCTEVNSFGTYTAFPQNEFKPGQHVLLYAEVENFKSEESPKGFHTAMRSSYHIFDNQGRKVADQELPLTEEHCQNRRRDYFIRYFLSIRSPRV